MYKALLVIALISTTIAMKPSNQPNGFKKVGGSGAIVLVSVSPSEKHSEDGYRIAVANLCGTTPICKVHFWVERAPTRFPITDAEISTRLVLYQRNLNTGLNRWLVNCKTAKVFSSERQCI
jgi:hypothetical protein